MSNPRARGIKRSRSPRSRSPDPVEYQIQPDQGTLEYRLDNDNQIRASRFCDICSKALSTIYQNIHKPAPKATLKIGSILHHIVSQDSCSLCRFLVDTTHLLTPDNSYRVSDKPEQAKHVVTLQFDPKPWFHKVGVSTELPSCPYAWLHIGDQRDAPLICVSFEANFQTSSGGETESSSVQPFRRPLLQAFNGSVDMEMIKGWISICERTHQCFASPTAKTAADFLVIDVFTIRVTAYKQGQQYAALSYVWGLGSSQQAARVRSSVRLEGQESGSDRGLLSDLPITMQDAITVTRKLGIPYLWIDLFCIDQNDEIRKQEQMNQMDEIFASASLTIVCVDGPHSDYGLPGISRPMLQTRQPVLELPWGRMMATHIYSLWDHLGTSPWDTRAWTLQERLLSRRCLFFGNAFFAMSCKQGEFHDLMRTDAEAIEHDNERHDEVFREDGSSINLDVDYWNFENYGNLVSVFTGRNITDQADVYNACRGSLQRITSKTQMRFHYGLPRAPDHDRASEFLQSLLWAPHFEHVLTRRLGFPSWSWLGWVGRSEYSYWLHYHNTDTFRPDVTGQQRKLRLAERFAECHPLEARIAHDLALTAPVVQLQTRMRKFKVQLLPKSGQGTIHKARRDVRKKEVGDLWALLGHDGSIIVNQIGQYHFFESTRVSFRLHEQESNEVQRQGCQVDLIFIKYWPYVWGETQILWDYVSALVVVKDSFGSFNRLAAVMIPAEKWLETDLQDATVTIV